MEFYSLEEVSEMLQIPRRTLYHWLDKKELKGYKIGRHWRIKREDLERFLEENANKEA
jgi:excisionase family DNA binding protein